MKLYDGGKIFIGLLIFVGIAAFPVLLQHREGECQA